jgi:hypothetical protein
MFVPRALVAWTRPVRSLFALFHGSSCIPTAPRPTLTSGE